MSTFPKLIFLSEKWGKKRQITEEWTFRVEQDKKLFEKNNEKEQQELIEISARMSEALECRGWKKIIKIYWGENIVHKEKYEKSIKEVKKFRNK